MENTDLQKLFKVRNTTLKLLRDRKYDIPVGAEKLNIDDFKLLWEKGRHHLYFPDLKVPDNDKSETDEKSDGGVLVYFESSDDFTKKILESRISQLSKEYPKLARLFFVLKTSGVKKSKINNFVSSALSNYPNVRILENIFPFDIMKNILVPECFHLTESQKQEVLEVYETPLDKFPKFELSDPIPMLFGAKVGDMFKIKRYGGAEISYRVVVKSGSG